MYISAYVRTQVSLHVPPKMLTAR
uniref:Uncharacterized protein n=1 Tax=Arundo donax TaxID=35708 RepID=A0A0A8YI50_ARUDO